MNLIIYRKIDGKIVGFIPDAIEISEPGTGKRSFSGPGQKHMGISESVCGFIWSNEIVEIGTGISQIDQNKIIDLIIIDGKEYPAETKADAMRWLEYHMKLIPAKDIALSIILDGTALSNSQKDKFNRIRNDFKSAYNKLKD